MGFLSDGKTVAFEDAKSQKLLDYVRQHGIIQFVAAYKRNKDRKDDPFKWGDELEYQVLYFDHERKQVRLALTRGEATIKKLNDTIHALEKPTNGTSNHNNGNGETHDVAVPQELSRLLAKGLNFQPEYGNFMVEATPAGPYAANEETRNLFIVVEDNMLARRKAAQFVLGPNEMVMSITNFPILGKAQSEFTNPVHPLGGEVSQSEYLTDQVINSHPRFATLTRNIRTRRGRKVDIRIPTFRDVSTTHADVIHMDAMGFGMGMCCLQCTFQTENVTEARFLYDQMVLVAPLVLALTAATPIFRGVLADIDVRWRIIAGAVDDRTPEELGEAPLVKDRHVIPKSRYDSVSTFLSDDPRSHLEVNNDIPLVIDKEFAAQLESSGVDATLARHVAHLFVRDPLVIYSHRIELDDARETDHFENIQSTNWQSARFKVPPPSNPEIGWRVELRTMEIQITDFENAAFAVFSALLRRAIRQLNLEFYIPISKVDVNMDRAHRRNAALEQRFFWRKPGGAPGEFAEQTLDQIFNGPSGLLPLVRSYVDTLTLDDLNRKRIDRYLTLISKRASGELPTAASWIRNFVQRHPAYAHDSLINDEINYDLLTEIGKISTRESKAPELLAGLDE